MNTTFFLNNFSFGFAAKSPLFFENVSIQIDQPGIIFLLGKNGAGKSTLFRLLQGDVGRSEVCGGTIGVHNAIYDMALVADRQKLHDRSIILHQSFDSMLAPSFTGFQNLQFCRFDTIPTLEFVGEDQNISDFAKQFNIPLEKTVAHLSGGQRQMLAMLMVTQKPLDLLLLDEPTAALDTKNSRYLMDGILQLALERNITVLCVSHDMDLVAEYGENAIEITQRIDGKRVFERK